MELISEKLCIPPLYIRKTQLKDVYIAALPQKWCLYIKKNLKLPDEFENHATYSPDEVQAFLWDSESLISPDWILVYINVIPKCNHPVLSTSSIHPDMGLDVKDLTYSQYLHYVSQTNFKNLWKESQKKFPEAYRPFALNRGRRSNPKNASWQESLSSLLARVFSCPIISLESGSVLHPTSQSPSCVLQAFGVFECSSNFFVITEHIPHSVHQCLSLSPSLLSSNSVKPMFLLFQMLHAVKEMQDRSLFVEGVSWQHFFINESLSLKVLPALASSLIPLEPVQPTKQEASLQELTTSWVRGCLSNYDYLMALNDLAGRQINNPFNHPVLPWISDLSSPFGNWRDLAKSKFRLNKGDRQLDLTFDPTTFEAPEGKEDVLPSQVPHHVTDVLSEITYYVYQARRTVRSVLCRYVRPTWNPLEYPTSIERMQQWTPDECIPQFFSDPSIFKSIHDDLPDLSYPPWASSPEDFITKHRNALESPYVSERLHQWIDLTFGFRLSGSAAIKAKNVHLSLVDGHVDLSSRGVVQLFSQPHPRKLLPSPYVGRSPPRLPPAEEQLSLPLDYNPVGLLRQLETVSHFYGSTAPDSQELAITTVAGRRQRDLQWLVTLAMELFIPQRFRLIRLSAKLEERWQICQDIVRFDRHLLPRSLRSFIQIVFQNETVTAQGLPPPSAHQLLQPMVSLIPFPSEFPAVLTATHQLKQLLDQGNVDFPGVGKTISSFTCPSSIALVIPFVKALLLKSTTAFRAALYLLDPIAAALGPTETAKEFLNIILKIMGPEQPSAPLVLLYHKRFLLMLQVRLGIRCFLQNISLLIVEGVGGCYNADSVTSVQQLLVAPSTSSLSPNLDRLKLGKEQEQESETEIESGDVFTFEVGEEAALMEQSSGEETGAVSGTPSRNSVKYSLATAAYPVRDIHELDGCTVSQVSVDSLLWQAHRLGPVLTARYLTRNLLRMLALCYADETSLNLADPSQESSPFQISGVLLQGDFNANRILGCLASIANLYGEQFVMLQYFPHAAEVVSRCISSGTISIMLEGGLVGSCSLILACIPCLPDSNFMQCLREVLLRQLLDPIVSAVTSTEQTFARGGAARSALAIKLLDCLCALSIRLGTDAAGQFISDPALKLLKSFDRVSKVASHPSVSRANSLKGRPDYMCHQRRLSNTLRQAQAAAEIEAASSAPSNNVTRPAANEALSLTEMAATFTDHFAFQLLTALNLILGVRHVQSLVEQGGQAAQTCATQYASTKDVLDADPECYSKRRTSVFSGLRVNRSFSSDVEAAAGSSYGSRISVVGNRIQLFAEEETVPETQTDHCDSRPTLEEAQDLLCYRKTDSARHLRGNWLAYWEHEAGRAERDSRFNFKQIRLLQLNGHSAGIRSIHVMDSETGLLTAGRDKTARVWSLNSQGDGNNSVSASYVYQQHRKPLLGVSFIDTARLAASCDGAVHLWDPFVGTSVRQLDASSSKFPTVTAMKALPAQPILVTATAEGTLRMLDTRTPLTYQHELRISPVAAGLVRCLATGSNGYWVAAGHSSGILSLMDTRTGMLLSSWKGHEGEVLQVNGWTSSHGSQHLISSSLDQSVSVWSADDGKLKFNFRGASEPVHCLCITGGGELVTGTTANRIGVYTSLTNNANFSSTKLRSDTFKGVLTAMAVVPLNRMLLLGSDTGVVNLLC
ncbi:WD repeat-containing protein 81-like isoform X2 [Daphnia pulex]|uniref:WD repeat-containing protein 81-like isoform X2 n=1 Tax=Daphnia pulex TaxID=6669 RepID=UPI001EDED749|nr:WD repeat-containing protein 81-like isoform X2 [Daphnia pulex]